MDPATDQVRILPKTFLKIPSNIPDTLTPHPSSESRQTATTTPMKKLTSPFSWLTRISSKDAPSTATTVPEQLSNKHTSTAVSFRVPTNGHSELLLNRIENERKSDIVSDKSEAASTGASLRDRFKLQRMKGQAGIDSLGEGDTKLPDGKDGVPASAASDSSEQNGSARHSNHVDQPELEPRNQLISPSTPLTPSRLDQNLAPGTAAGMTAGPSSMVESDAHVDWDLWQALVYEGPVIVAQKSSEELCQAIASGIPSAIRGVVWQVLANSKNTELEKIFEDLASWLADSGTRKLLSPLSLSILSPIDTTSDSRLGQEEINGLENDRTGVMAYSRATDHMMSPASTSNGVKSSTPADADGGQHPVQPPTMTSLIRQYQLKPFMDDAATLQKLEKAIKRDLGARTSFSKYALSAGLQDSLFRVCKAYALFDKEVGYAQGMNFLAMPLLFSVSSSYPTLIASIAEDSLRCLKERPSAFWFG